LRRTVGLLETHCVGWRGFGVRVVVRVVHS
jgi:hypothetical protein